MDGSHLRPPEYALPPYDDDPDLIHTHSRHPAAIRLLTSNEDQMPDNNSYVRPQPGEAPQTPVMLSPQKESPRKDEYRDENNNEESTNQAVVKAKKTVRIAVPARCDSLGKDDEEQTISESPTRQLVPTRSPTVKLQRKKKQPMDARQAALALSLPAIPEGPSPRKRSLREIVLARDMAAPRESGNSNSNSHSNNSSSGKPNEDDSRDSPMKPDSIRPTTRRSYQSSVQSYSSSDSLNDNPHMHRPDSAYDPYLHRDNSPPRPWTASSRISGFSDYSRPPPSQMSYEPVDYHGSPRPGSSSSHYGGSPRRPLPPAPFPAHHYHSNYSTDDVTVSMPLEEEEDIDDYGPDSDVGAPHGYPGYAESQITINEDGQSIPMDEKFGHYGAVPEGKQERRGVREPVTSKKEVQLINGELILECKIPTILYSFLPRRDEVEFTHMRYTAVTCDPDDFVERGYKLRQNIGRTARETELFICVTMYNEDEIGFTRTMHAIMKNISHFCGRNKSRTWGELGWQKIVVCVVSDGREKVHLRTLDALAAMGVYQHGIAKNFVNSKAVQAHVYEYTTQVSLDSDLKFKGAEKGIVPCQMIFCLKERNQRKLNSHRWFFNAFGKALNPNICILLDVGTKPGATSLYHLWKAFDIDSNVAGACGEIKAMTGKFGNYLLNPLVASQNFEYKMSNILDKPLESVFGYITVLPGALSAYRFHALQNDETGHGPLSQYFKGETLHGQHADVFTANMYLAEDRILCWELVAKRNERWVLKYVKSCTGETDVPDAVPEFISQRRRWLNGAFFAAVYSLVHFRQVWATDHTVARKVLLHIEFIYQFIQLFFTYFSLANYYLAFYFLCGGLSDPRIDPFGHNAAFYIFTILRYAFVLLTSMQFILSLGNRPQGAKRLYMTSIVIYSIIMIYTVFATAWIIVHTITSDGGIKVGSGAFTNLILSISSTVGLYFLMSFLYLDPWHLFTSSAQYFALLPGYICTLQVYAFCNTHDVTWGTKGDNVMKTDLGGAVGSDNVVELEMPSEQLDIDSGYDEALRNLRDRVEVPQTSVSEAQLQEDYYRSVRTYMVVIWMVANAILAMAVSEAYGIKDVGNNFYLSFILWSVAVLAVFRGIGSATFAVLNAVNMVVEGRVRISLKMPEWAGEFGTRVSETVSSVATSVRG